MSNKAEKLKRIQQHTQLCLDEYNEWAARGYGLPRPPSRPFPDDLRDIRCEAKTRAGTPCKMKATYANGRCKLHGGLSTGAKTAEGKERQLEGFYRWLEAKKLAKANRKEPDNPA
ncbi:hypothetical protein A8A01_24155 [Ewingella americana]|nr:hypothetical protein A8A01_24155 [Ewingella americana]